MKNRKQTLIIFSQIMIFAFTCMISSMLPNRLANAAKSEKQTNSAQGDLDYSEEAVNDSLQSYTYAENPYYLEGLEKYVGAFNEFYDSMEAGQQVEIMQLEDALKDADISSSLRKKILSAEGKNVLEDEDFKRVEEEEDKKLFFSKGKYFEVSSRAKDDVDEIDVLLNVTYYLGDLKKNKPNGKGALFRLSDSGIRLFYAGGFKEGRLSGKGIFFSQDSFGAVILGQGEFKEHVRNGKFTEYNADDIQQMYLFYEEKWAEYTEYYYNQYSENQKNQVNLFEKNGIAKLVYTVQKYEGEEWDSFFDVRVDYPVIKPAVTYKGKCSKDNYSGKGTLYGKTGTLWYEGEFKGGTFSGKGTLYYAMTGIKQYEGQFKNGLMNGKGTLYNADGTIRKKGTFKNEEADYENEMFEEVGIYDYLAEQLNDIEAQELFEKDDANG